MKDAQERLSISIPHSLKIQAIRKAQKEQRSVSAMIRVLLEKHVKTSEQ